MSTGRALQWVAVFVTVICVAPSEPRGARELPSRHLDPEAAPSAGSHHHGVFVPNLGQWRHSARYAARFGAGTVFLEPDGWTIALADGKAGGAFRMRLANAREGALVPEGRLSGTHSYFLGSEPGRWRTGVPRYRSVLYRSLLSGVDLRVYERQGAFEYDVVLSGGADLRGIVFAVEGARSVRIDPSGDLWIDTDLGAIRQPCPTTYEVDPDGTRWPIDCRYEMRGGKRFGFTAVRRNATRTLVIDPGLEWSTFLGGQFEDAVYDVFADPSGIVTVAGTSRSSDYPATLGAFGPIPSGQYDGVVTRLDPSRPPAQQLVYSTFLGGSVGDIIRAIAVDAAGVVTLVGDTTSADWPTTPNAWSRTPNLQGDAVVARLDPLLPGPRQLAYSTYVGGSSTDYAFDVAVSSFGITFTGATFSTDWPTTAGAWDRSANGLWDGFVTRLHWALPANQQLRYSTYLGGSGSDGMGAIHVDGSARVVVAGHGSSADYPTTAGAWDTTHNGGGSDVVVTLLDPSLATAQQIVYSTFVGGSRDEAATSLSAHPSGGWTLAGFSMSSNYPTTAGAWNATFNGGLGGAPKDTFVTRIDPSLLPPQQLVYSTFLGGSGNEIAEDVCTDAAGMVTVAGWTGSSDFPTTDGAWDRSFNGGRGGWDGSLMDVFVARLDPSLPSSVQLIYSTFLGGSQDEFAASVYVDAAGGSTLGGSTGSADFPTTSGAFDPTYNGGTNDGGDGFVTRLDMLPIGARRIGRSSHGCSGLLASWVASVPRVGNQAFAIACSNAPPTAGGVLVFSLRGLPVPVVAAGIEVWIDPATMLWPAGVKSNARGTASFALPIPADARLAGATFAAQWIWATATTPPPCPPLGLSASPALVIVIQP